MGIVEGNLVYILVVPADIDGPNMRLRRTGQYIKILNFGHGVL